MFIAFRHWIDKMYVIDSIFLFMLHYLIACVMVILLKLCTTVHRHLFLYYLK